MLCREEPPVGVEGDPVRVAEPPGHQLEIAAVGLAAEHRAIAPHVPADDLTRMRLRAERDVCARLDRRRRIAQDVGELVVVPGQDHVRSRYVVGHRELGEPLVGVVVGTDHAGVGVGALPEVDLAVRANDRVVALVVALARQVCHQILEPTVGGDPGEGVGVHQVEVPVVPAGPGDRAGVVPAILGQLEEHFRLTGSHVDLEDAWLGLDLVAALDDVAAALLVEAAVHGRVEPGCDHLDSEALGN